MRCAITSRAGQVLARGKLVLSQEAEGQFRLDLITDRGKHLQGGIIDADGDMMQASSELSRKFFDVWGMSNLQLKITL